MQGCGKDTAQQNTTQQDDALRHHSANTPQDDVLGRSQICLPTDLLSHRSAVLLIFLPRIHFEGEHSETLWEALQSAAGVPGVKERCQKPQQYQDVLDMATASSLRTLSVDDTLWPSILSVSATEPRCPDIRSNVIPQVVQREFSDQVGISIGESGVKVMRTLRDVMVTVCPTVEHMNRGKTICNVTHGLHNSLCWCLWKFECQVFPMGFLSFQETLLQTPP